MRGTISTTKLKELWRRIEQDSQPKEFVWVVSSDASKEILERHRKRLDSMNFSAFMRGEGIGL